MTGGNDDVMTSFVVLAATYIHFFEQKKFKKVKREQDRNISYLVADWLIK